MAKAIVHKKTDRFIDIEVPISDAWVGCDFLSEKIAKDSAWMSFYALEGDISHMFFFRRPLGRQGCRETESDYRKLLKGVSTIRIVGITPTEGKHDPSPRVPRRFTSPAKGVGWIFIRLETGKGCESYFVGDCKLPENYWGGLSPH